MGSWPFLLKQLENDHFPSLMRNHNFFSHLSDSGGGSGLYSAPWILVKPYAALDPIRMISLRILAAAGYPCVAMEEHRSTRSVSRPVSIFRVDIGAHDESTAVMTQKMHFNVFVRVMAHEVHPSQITVTPVTVTPRLE